MSEENGMPTVQKPKRGAKKVWGKGGEPNFMSESMMNGNKDPIEEGVRPHRERRGCSIAPLGRNHQGGGEGVVVDPTMISLVLRFQSPEVPVCRGHGSCV